MQVIPLPRRSRAQADGEPSPRRGSAEGRYTPPSEDLIHLTRVDTLIKGVRNVIPEQQSRIETGDTLWCAGDLSLVKKSCIAIVGTRQVSSEGAARSRRLARELVERGIVVVSGLAKGVDTEALTSAIEHGGRVIAVIGTPIDRAYPAENKHLQEKIYREHLLISQFAPGERVFPSNFPERNKLMAAVSDGTAIIEAGETSGTLHQAAECVRLGRWLFLAKSVVDNPKLEWPKKFVSYSHYVALKTTQDILEAIRMQGS